MTQEQEKAAKWEAREQFKSLQSRKAILAVQAQNWGYELAKTSKALIANGESIIHLDLINFPDKIALLELQNELQELFPRLKSLRNNLEEMGAL